MESAKVAAKALKEAKREERMAVGAQAKDLLSEVDADGSGELSEEELRCALQETNLASILADLGVPSLGAGDLVRLLDYSGNGQVSYEELVNGIVKMDEELCQRDYIMLGFWTKSLLARTTHLEERLEKLCAQISFIRKRLNGAFESLQFLIRSAKDSQLRTRAIQIIRTSGPAVPLSLEKKKVEKKGMPWGKEPKEQVVDHMSRFLGGAPIKKPRTDSPDQTSSPEPRITKPQPVRAPYLFRNTMAPAPQPRSVAVSQAQRDMGRWAEDRYGLVETHHENPNLRALKRLMH
jgi:hypothetical protein